MDKSGPVTSLVVRIRPYTVKFAEVNFTIVPSRYPIIAPPHGRTVALSHYRQIIALSHCRTVASRAVTFAVALLVSDNRAVASCRRQSHGRTVRTVTLESHNRVSRRTVVSHSRIPSVAQSPSHGRSVECKLVDWLPTAIVS
jgi:hypothetical protein